MRTSWICVRCGNTAEADVHGREDVAYLVFCQCGRHLEPMQSIDVDEEMAQ